MKITVIKNGKAYNNNKRIFNKSNRVFIYIHSTDILFKNKIINKQIVFITIFKLFSLY